MKRARRVRGKPGDIVAIPIGEGLFAFGRLYRDASIGVLDRIASRALSIDELGSASERFVTGFFSTAVKDGTWKIIGRRPFGTEDEEWPPPKRVQDIVSPEKIQIYHRGVIRPARDTEVEGLELASMSRPEQLVVRIRSELARELSSATRDRPTARAKAR